MTSRDTNRENELTLLEAIHRHQPNIRQRDLAEIAGLSLGMTNSILKRLTEKGWITVRRLNSRNVRYAVTPDGVEEILHRSYAYVKRTIKHVVGYRRTFERFAFALKEQGFARVILIGGSDLDFVVEHALSLVGLSLIRRDTVPEQLEAGDFLLYGEGSQRDPGFHPIPCESCDYISRILIDECTIDNNGEHYE